LLYKRLIEKHFTTLEDDDQHAKIKQGLYDLVSNVILFEEENSNGLQYHFRFGWKALLHSVTSMRTRSNS